MITILIVDDHPVVRDGLAAVLATQPDLQVVGAAGTSSAALREVAAQQPDVVLMDLQLPDLDGIATTAAIREHHPRTRVVVLTSYDTDADIIAAIEAGAVGYLLKDADRDQLCAAIRAASNGTSALSPAVAAKVLSRMRGEHGPALSSREIEVLTAAARGQANKQIAKALHVSEATVKTHLLHIYTKLGVEDRTAAVATALDKGIIRLG
ncbi:MAG: response regulator [Actinophytocola sp.]|uniref:response regulator n=1 Tax=Actinophytocola sp. TaxID=1872138 RepID=UPI0013248992|nr:response regulator transcription factor [Actinophytocola sp.]MPZ81932.1 response regulator [Actinophytocola sp.]